MSWGQTDGGWGNSGFTSESHGGFGGSGWGSNDRHKDGPTDPQGTHSNMCVACNVSAWQNGGLLRVHYDETCPGCRLERSKMGFGREGFGGVDYRNLQDCTNLGFMYGMAYANFSKSSCDTGSKNFLSKNPDQPSTNTKPPCPTKSIYEPDEKDDNNQDKQTPPKRPLFATKSIYEDEKDGEENMDPPDYNTVVKKTRGNIIAESCNTHSKENATERKKLNAKNVIRENRARDVKANQEQGKLISANTRNCMSLWSNEQPQLVFSKSKRSLSIWESCREDLGELATRKKSLWD